MKNLKSQGKNSAIMMLFAVQFPIAPYMLSGTDPEIFPGERGEAEDCFSFFNGGDGGGGVSVFEGFLCNFTASIIIMKFDSIFDNKHNKSCKLFV